jgi:hypothetical protein
MHPSSSAPSPWDVARSEGDGGTGNWRALRRSVDDLHNAASSWKAQVGGRDKLWLCWNVNEDWCFLQQRLALEVGWTPVVGWDPNSSSGPPTRIAPGAVVIDFNALLRFPVLFPHVAIDLAHLWADRLAFWHSDMLLSRRKMQHAAIMFGALEDGELAAVLSLGGLRNLLRPRAWRYWEVLGCTTKGASAAMFDTGSGWWRHWALHHVNTPDSEALRAKRATYHQDHGGGVLWWKNHHGGHVRRIAERFVTEGHFSITSKKDYVKAPSKSEEMAINFDLQTIARRFEILDLMR